MRRSSLCLLAAGLALLAAPSAAVVCTIDDVPAATLLLPYFEVDLDDPDGITTLFSVNNASATAVLAHVVVWSDLSVPVLDFNIYLTGYDVQSINLRDILVNGVLPRTASDGQDPQDLISPQGDFSADINFASCNGQLPPPILPAQFISHLQSSLTGQFSSILGGCAGLDLDDRIARGYVTVDTVNNCTLRFPGDPGYFVAGGTGDATNQNVLWGDAFHVEPGENFAQGETLVHIEADAQNPETSVPGEYTFYGRYVAWTAADNREPLAADVAVRYLDGGAFDGGTDLLVWRDAKVSQGAFKCGTLPVWYPLGQEGILIVDEQENVEQPEVFPVSPQPIGPALTPFPAEAQRTRVGGPDLPVTPSFGWLYLALGTAVLAAGPNPPEDPLNAQAWAQVVMDAEGRFSVGYDAVTLEWACRPGHPLSRPDLVASFSGISRTSSGACMFSEILLPPDNLPTILVSATVKNQGSRPAVSSLLSATWTTGTGDPLDPPSQQTFLLPIPQLAGGETSAAQPIPTPSCFQVLFPLPACTILGLAVEADSGEVVFESNENNNGASVICESPLAPVGATARAAREGSDP